MASHSARQAGSSLLSNNSRCLCPKMPAAARLLVPRRCLYQEPAAPAPADSPSYRPVRLRPIAPFPVKEQKPFPVNNDPEVLEAMYEQLIGEDLGLSDKVKWQAVTHKSFDHGWQPYNEKLEFFGKRVMLVHASLHHLYTRPEHLGPKTYTAPTPTEADSPVLKPFRHPDYHYLTFVNRKNIKGILDPKRLGILAHKVKLPQAMRWKPAHNEDLSKSAQTGTAVCCLYAIIGAVALQRGGGIAGKLIRDRILGAMDIP